MTRTRKKTIFDNKHPLEIAQFIKKQVDQGKKQKDIAKEIGYSQAHVTKHLALLSMPDVFSDIFTKTTDVTLIFDLINAYKTNPGKITTFLSENKKLTRLDFKILTTGSRIKTIQVRYKDTTATVIRDKRPTISTNLIIRVKGSRTPMEVPLKDLALHKIVWC